MKFSTTKALIFLAILVIWEANAVAGKRTRVRDEDDVEDDSSASSSTEALPPIRIKLSDNFPDRPKRYDGITINDPVSSSQNISPAVASGYNNPFLLNNQGSLLNNPALYGNTAAAATLGAFGLQNPYLGAAGAAGLGGLSNLNPYANNLQSQLLLQQGGQGAGLAGLYTQDIYSQQAGVGGVGGFYNPLFALNNLGIGGIGGIGGIQGIQGIQGIGGAGGYGGFGATGINPYLLGRTGYLGQNYLAQSLLSPYTSYNQLNPYNTFPFSSRFGVGRASNRINPGSSSSNSNNDE